MEYTIKDVTGNDVKGLQAISRETFKATFDEYTAPADMVRFLKEDYATEKLLTQINNPDSRFFFLMVKDEVAGYLKVNVNSAQTENVKPNALEVERIYLRQKFQHQGLGLVLIKLAEKIARKENYDYMWLGVYEHNLIAQKFYKKDGFTRVGQHVFQVGEDPQIDYILAKKLD
ncbi:GNAT family N-acetyltransferase [Lactobacillus intestinalis]|uniref:GNAT family N-acetyltransferase n=1 Tax=Lactobacillus intestinalis TaxID=151781 RepID=A0A4S2BHT2_9LACO|nr:GNAT family N-acetyltransferase [Lactobacillus intestinalis]TGY14041.1 GNAT family N-acetyltransferase [Lactobacillus intestinalis]